MKKRIFIVLTAAVLTIQTAYGMEKDEKEKKPNDRWIQVVVEIEPIVINVEKPHWLVEVMVNPEAEAVQISCNLTDSICSGYFNSDLKHVNTMNYIKKFLEELQKKVKFTKVSFDNSYGCLRTKGGNLKKLTNAIFDSSKNITSIDYSDQWEKGVHIERH